MGRTVVIGLRSGLHLIESLLSKYVPAAWTATSRTHTVAVSSQKLLQQPHLQISSWITNSSPVRAARVIAATGEVNPDTSSTTAAAAAAKTTTAAARSMQLLELLQRLAAPADHAPSVQELDLAVNTLQPLMDAVSVQRLLQLLAATAAAAPQLASSSTPAQLLPLLTSSIVQHLPQLTPRQLAAMLTDLHTAASTAQQQQQQLQGRRALLTAVSTYCRQLLGQSQGHGQQHRQQYRPAVVACDAAGTAALVRALGLPSYRHQSSLTLLAVLAMDHMKVMTPQQLVELMDGFAAAQHWNQAVAEASLQSAVSTLKQQQHQLLPDEQDKQQQEAVGQQQPQQHQHSVPTTGFTAAQLVDLLRSCSQLRHHDVAFLDAAVTAALNSLGQLQLQQVVSIAHASAHLNHYSMAFFQAACRLVMQAVTEWQQQQQHQDLGRLMPDGRVALVTDLAWSCAVLGHTDVPFLQQLAAMSSQIDIEQLSQQQLLQWFEVRSWLTDAAVQQPELRNHCATSNHLLLAAQNAWLHKLSSRRTSKFQSEVHRALKSIGKTCRVNVALDGPCSVDIELRMQHRSKVAVQLEGPEAFAVNPPHEPLGPTAARWRALQTRGWQVLVVRYTEWRRLKTDEDRCLYAWHIKDAAATRALGPALEVIKLAAQPVGPTTAAGAAAAAGKPHQPSLGKKLWKLLLD